MRVAGFPGAVAKGDPEKVTVPADKEPLAMRVVPSMRRTWVIWPARLPVVETAKPNEVTE